MTNTSRVGSGELTFDSSHPVPQVDEISAEFFKHGRRKIGAGVVTLTAFRPYPPKVVFREAEGTRDVREGRSVAGLLDSVLDLPERRDRDARPLGQLPLSDSPLLHPIVDDARHPLRVTHVMPS
jgi:hypothetical protein